MRFMLHFDTTQSFLQMIEVSRGYSFALAALDVYSPELIVVCGSVAAQKREHLYGDENTDYAVTPTSHGSRMHALCLSKHGQGTVLHARRLPASSGPVPHGVRTEILLRRRKGCR